MDGKMKSLNIKKYFSVIICLLLLGVASCSDHRLDYISSPKLYLPKSGEVDLIIYKTGEPFVFKLGVTKSGIEDVAADAQLSIMSEAELAAYNSANNTNYKRLPDNCFNLNNSNVSFDKESKLEYFDILIRYDSIDQIADFDEENSADYVIPARLSDASLETNEEKLIAIIKPVLREPLIYFKSSETKVTIEAGKQAAYREDIDIQVDFDNYWDISVDLVVDPALADEYNASNGVNLPLLPAESYSITPSPAVIANGKKSVKVSIELNADLIDYDDFILPIVIDGTSKFSADTAKNVHYLYVSKPAMRFDRTGWTIVDFSSEEPSGEGANNGTAICVLDGNPATYWHSQWAGATGQLPHHFTIDMKKELLVTSVDLQRRPNQRDTQGGNFYISSDNVTFTYIGSFQMAEVDEPQTFKVTSTHGRYLKVEITESRRPPFANMSEVYVRGVE
ncbi:BT_3987 domain-containing protein [Petrimonas mucosa]|nr:DUF1735 domain-containing protein [Petrimonas mucosa]